MKHFLLIVFFPIFLFASMQKVSVQLEWKHQFEFAGFYAAIEQGYYKDIGLDVTLKEFEDGVNISDDIIHGKATFGVSSSSLILEKLQNKPVVLMASFFKQNALVLATSKNIKKIADLKNKTIMAMPYEIDHTSLGVMLHDNKLKKDDFTLVSHDFNVNRFINGEVDAMSIFISSQPYILDKKDIKYNILNPSDYGIYSYDCELFTSQKFAKQNPQLVHKFTQATIKGWQYAFEHKDEIVDLIYEKYSKRKSKESLLYEAIQTQKIFKTDIFAIGAIVPELVELNALIYEKLGLVDKNVNLKKLLSSYIFTNIYEKSKTAIKKKRIIKEDSSQMILSEKEKIYIDKKEKITMCIDPAWMPFESFKDGEHIGLSADYFKIFQNKIGVPIEVVYSQNWKESLLLAKTRECDIISLIMQTQDRKKYMNFTTPYLRIPVVLATKTDVAFITNFNDLADKKVGIPAGYAFGSLLKKKYPNLNIIEVKNIDDGLNKVTKGELFAYIGSAASIGYLFQKKYIGELKIAGKFDKTWDLGVGVRNDDITLLSIFEKAVKSVSDNQHRDIFNKWVAIEYNKRVDYTLVWQIVFVSFIILTTVLLWMRKLSSLNKQLQIAKTKADEETKIKANFLANISHEIRTPMNSIVGMSYLLRETKLNQIQNDYMKKIESSSNNLVDLINEILDFSKLEAKKLVLEKIDFNLIELLNNIENILMVKVYEKKLKFKIIYDKSDSIYLYGDKLRLTQVLINLLSNAIKFTPKGEIELIIKKLDNNIFRFSVSDTGIGIEESQIKDIFSSFTQADVGITRKYGGTGLGLAISKDLVELMGGEIAVESSLSMGSKFSFEIELLPSDKAIIDKDEIQKTTLEPESREKLSPEQTKKLFEELKSATKKRRPQLCEPILQEFEKYSLDEKNQELFQSVKILIKKYKFDDAGRLL